MARRTLLVAGVLCVLAMALVALGQVAEQHSWERLASPAIFTGSARTPDGEWIKIEVMPSQSIRWGHSYNVNGSGSYDIVKFTCSVKVTYQNVEDVMIDYASIKAYGTGTGQSVVYTILDDQAVSSSDTTYSNSIESYIQNHLDALGYNPLSTSGMEVKYYVGVKVVATGSISGEQIVAKIDYTWFKTLVYTYVGTGSTPGGTISWPLVARDVSFLGLLALVPITVLWAWRALRASRR